MLRFHNTLTRTIEPFAAPSSGLVTLYTCGPTIYNYLHVGNWAAYIYWDTLVRTLRANNLRVKRVMNITDVGHLTSDADDGEDKLEKGARQEGKTAWDIAEFYTKDFLEGMQELNLLPPEVMVRATDYIPQQLELIRTLKEKGYTYQIDDGIYFDTAKFPTYADFAQLDIEAQRAGARVVFNTAKRNPSDFALWKFTSAGIVRDMEWETPSDITDMQTKPRKGFPGWHLECSAIALATLGSTIDIHTGGIDHIPVHHTNEIAQSEAATGQLFVRTWLHNNHIKSNGVKISKSLGNGYTLTDLRQRGFTPLDYRMFVLQGHYSNEGNFTFENLQAARNRLKRWREVAALQWQTFDIHSVNATANAMLAASTQELLDAISNNLNTPEALRIVDATFETVLSVRPIDIHRTSLISFLDSVDSLLGLQLRDTPDITKDATELLGQRWQARQAKDWATSDALRSELAQSGIGVRDTASATVWYYL